MFGGEANEGVGSGVGVGVGVGEFAPTSWAGGSKWMAARTWVPPWRRKASTSAMSRNPRIRMGSKSLLSRSCMTTRSTVGLPTGE